MKLKLFTFRLGPGAEGFDDRELLTFCADRDVLAVQERFFVHQDVPTWALLVSYRDVLRPGDREPAAAGRTDWRAELDDGERALFDKIRRWRNDRAKRHGRPPYALFTNQQMAEIARRQPRTQADLREVHGIGEAKLRDFGDELLAMLAEQPAAPPPRAEPEAAAPDGASAS